MHYINTTIKLKIVISIHSKKTPSKGILQPCELKEVALCLSTYKIKNKQTTKEQDEDKSQIC